MAAPQHHSVGKPQNIMNIILGNFIYPLFMPTIKIFCFIEELQFVFLLVFAGKMLYYELKILTFSVHKSN